MESQKAINYITWESSRTVANSPFLEKPRKNRYDALCVTELLGEYAVQELREFGYHKLSCSTKTDEAGEEKKLGERKAMLEPIFKPLGWSASMESIVKVKPLRYNSMKIYLVSKTRIKLSGEHSVILNTKNTATVDQYDKII
ncbi:Heat shock protein Hsp90, related [Eimeria acervulina]|uniref:Heat shock protein Hsp90, related n=1 Tax=Eimeria acervulina TaxID=5801 RepID=U6GLY9_EIMAC|nr:Heat shock protein Hsp90, related [Eimeria acervulina]CDI80567.1 Heat shock protein Hsp90, related [Eimeria acervulina]